MSNQHISIGVDIGARHVSSTALDLRQGEAIAGSDSRLSLDSFADPDTILDTWTRALSSTLSRVAGGEVAGIGFAIPIELVLRITDDLIEDVMEEPAVAHPIRAFNDHLAHLGEDSGGRLPGLAGLHAFSYGNNLQCDYRSVPALFAERLRPILSV